MKKMIAIILITILFWSCEKKSEVITVGIVMPITGQLSSPAKNVINGIELAFNEFNKDIHLIKVELKIEDSEGSTEKALSAFKKLTEINGCNIIIGEFLSSSTIAMVKEIGNKKILIVSPTASSKLLNNINKYFFRVWPSDSYDAEISAKYCLEMLNLRNMAIVYFNNDYTIGLKDDFNYFFQIGGGKINAEYSYNPTDIDFRTIITKIKKSNVDGIYLPGSPKGNAYFVKQSKELGLNKIIFSNLSANENNFRTIAGNSTEGIYFSTITFDFNQNDSLAVNFVNKYKITNGEEPDIYSVKGYEAANILCEAFKTGHISPDSIRSFILHKKTFNLPSGEIYFDNSNNLRSQIILNRYGTNGKILNRVSY